MAQTVSAQITAIRQIAVDSSKGAENRSSEGAGFGDGWASPLW
jgi:hypothetical protein